MKSLLRLQAWAFRWIGSGHVILTSVNALIVWCKQCYGFQFRHWHTNITLAECEEKMEEYIFHPSAWSWNSVTFIKLDLLLAALFQVKGCIQRALAECMGHSCLLASPVVLSSLCHMCSLGTISEFNAVRRNFPFLKWSLSFFFIETCVMSWKRSLEL